MSKRSDLEVRKAEITAIVGDIAYLERELALKGLTDLGGDERAECLQIIARMERKMLANAGAAA